MAIIWYGVGDTVTTFIGLSFGEIAEVGPVAAPVIEFYGRPSLVAIKFVSFALFYATWRIVPHPTRAAVPLAVTLVGIAVTLWNLLMILSATV